MDSQTNILIALFAFLSAALGIYSQIRTKKLETEFSLRGQKISTTQTVQRTIIEDYKEFYKLENAEIKERLSKAEEKSCKAEIEVETAKEHHRQCEFRLARLETILDINKLLPDGYESQLIRK